MVRRVLGGASVSSKLELIVVLGFNDSSVSAVWSRFGEGDSNGISDRSKTTRIPLAVPRRLAATDVNAQSIRLAR